LTLFTSSETPLLFYFEKKNPFIPSHKKKQPGKDEELYREKERSSRVEDIPLDAWT